MLSQLRPYIAKGLQKVGLNKIAHKIYYRHLHGFQAAIKDTLPAVDRCFKKAQELGLVNHGEYHEYGVFKGYTFWYAQNQADSHGHTNMKFFGFDSFAGLPEVDGIDKTRNNDFYKGQYFCNKTDVEKNLNSKGVDWKRTFLIEGYFEDSLKPEMKAQHGMQKLSIALIDCDLYSSTVEVLGFVKDLLVEGSILMFDDWNCFDRSNDHGQRKAFMEFLNANPQFRSEEFFSYGPYGQVFIIHQI